MLQRHFVLVYTFCHFMIDFSCFYFLFSSFSRQVPFAIDQTVGILLYNVLAFGLQPLIGYLFDLWHKWNPALLGCLLLLAGLLMSFFPWVALILCALGNAFFHVGGGISSLLYTNGRMAGSGLFISSGALGVIFGTLAGSHGILSDIFVILSLILCGGLIFIYTPLKYSQVHFFL